ncbi:MAG: hypothetical protein AAF616_09640 [Bacteroidota bacterium]
MKSFLVGLLVSVTITNLYIQTQSSKTSMPRSKKINLTLLFAVTFLATSVALMNFQEPGWSGNEKSYIGLLAATFLWILGRKRK